MGTAARTPDLVNPSREWPNNAGAHALAYGETPFAQSTSTVTHALPGTPRNKRALDLGLTLIVGLVVFPLAVVIGFLVKVTSQGPVFFRQNRMGEKGTTFQILKFRTMRSGTDQEVLQCALQRGRYEANGFKLDEDDPRITKLGRFLRKTSLDELPQLLNVLRGEMSLVGIRPLLPEELAHRSPHDQECYKALAPGMTGLWQVSGRSLRTLDERIELDRRYIENWSLGMDIRILLQTPAAVVRVHHAK